MAKTNKELTVEIVCAYLQAWSGEGKKPLNTQDVLGFITNVHKTIQDLPE